RSLQNRDERLQRLDRELRLVEILRLAAQAVVAERGEGVERLQEQVGDLQLRQLGLKLLDQLLLVLRQPGLPFSPARRRSPRASRRTRASRSGAPPRSPTGCRDRAPRRSPPPPAGSTRGGARGARA